MDEYDVMIIGGGPGGYHAAGLAAEAGKKVLLVEKEALGGTCLNWGCIPTKTLLNLAKQCSYADELSTMGVTSQATYTHEVALRWKEKVVSALQSGVQAMLKKGKVNIVEGEAQIQSLSATQKSIEVTKNDASVEQFSGKHLIIASGVESVIPPIHGIESAEVLTSKDILSIAQLPKNLSVIGGGVIGIEIASLFVQLGSQVTVVEALPQILNNTEEESVKILQKVLEGQGITIHSGATVKAVQKNQLKIVDAQQHESTIPFDALLVSTGRKTNLDKFKSLGIDVSAQGIIVDDTMQSNIPNVYAIGDVAGSYQLAHVAYRMAEVAIGNILASETGASTTHTPKMRYNVVPSVVYTNPELASCGLTEAQAKETMSDVISASLPIVMSGRVIAEHGIKAKGYCKIIANKANGKILGIHLVSPMASEIISTASVILEAELSVSALTEIIFPHPTVGEILHNVSLALQHKMNQ